MELELHGDQELFFETTRRFLEAESPITEVRRSTTTPWASIADYWRRGAELGWTTMLVPDHLGGGTVSGDGLLDLVLVAEEMGRLVAPGPLLPVNVVADTIARSGTPEQQTAELAGLVDGALDRDAWAFAEPAVVWDVASVALTAARVPERRGPGPLGHQVVRPRRGHRRHLARDRGVPGRASPSSWFPLTRRT